MTNLRDSADAKIEVAAKKAETARVLKVETKGVKALQATRANEEISGVNPAKGTARKQDDGAPNVEVDAAFDGCHHGHGMRSRPSGP